MAILPSLDPKPGAAELTTAIEPRARFVQLVAICLCVGLVLYAAGLAEYLWLSLLLSVGIGLTIRGGKRWLQRLRPQTPLWLQYGLSTTVAFTVWGVIPASLRYRHLAHSDTAGISWLNYLPALLIGIVVTLVLTYIYFSRERAFMLQQALDKAEIQRIGKEKEILETRLRLLQSQIEPHFLFNTLANIQALISIEPKQATKMLAALTSLLRQSLNRTRQEWLTLGDELRFNRAYLAIQQIRLGERLQVELDVSDKLQDNQLFPPMLLQPLIENAIVHGIEPIRGGGRIRLSLHPHGERLHIELFNDGVMKPGSSAHKGHSVGLSTTRERVRQLFGADGLFTVTEPSTGGVLITMEIPLYVASTDSPDC